MKKIFLITLIILFVWSQYCYSANVVASVLKVATSSAAWSGSTRIVPVLLKAGNVAKWVVGSLSPASIAIIGASVIGQYALEHPEVFEKLGAWMAGHDYRIQSGSYQHATYTGGMVSGSPGALGLAAYNVWMAAAYGEGWGGWVTEIVSSSAGYTTRRAELLAEGAYSQTGSYHSESDIVANQTFIKQNCGGGGYCGVIALVYPVAPADYVGTPAWVNTTPAAVAGTWSSDWSGSPPAAAKSLYENIESKISQAQAQELSSPSASTMVDLPAYGQSGKTVAQVVEEQAKAGINSTVITNIENEGDITTNVDGDVTTINNATNTTIEAAKKEADGVSVAPVAPSAYAKSYENINTRVQAFWTSCKVRLCLVLLQTFLITLRALAPVPCR
jgi:hypothetical protein